MDLCRLFENLRGKFLSALKTSEDRVKEAKKLKNANEVVARLLKNKSKYKDVIKYIQNNRLAGYYVYLKEREILEPMSNCEALEKNTYERLQKLLNTINHLSAVGKEIHMRFLLIKSLNVLPYLPVYDVDVFAENSEIIEGFKEVSDVYMKSKEREENKYNFLPRDGKNFFKLSFHTEITWDGVKVEHHNTGHWWKNCIEVVPYVNINSPSVEALIRLQECLLERLYITLIDYLFLSNYLQGLKCMEISENFPKFIKFRNLKHSKSRLLLKNSSRWIVWRVYYLLTGKVPFHELCEE
ncbi:MAG: hypothetical protein APU95_02335 [Hadesarchaea archaeon YNP_N21]|nr:MAG: hypothetical protein APU95_02335 [Hadesarchaea archaeon YNP_N21]